MANLMVKIAETGETIPISDIELNQVTIAELILELVANNIVTKDAARHA